jgi:hypothetical protein
MLCNMESRRALADIVEDIVWALQGTLVVSRTEIGVIVRNKLEGAATFLKRKSVFWLSRDDRKRMEDEAKEIAAAAAVLQNALSKPSRIVDYLFTPQRARFQAEDPNVLAGEVFANKVKLLNRLTEIRQDCNRHISFESNSRKSGPDQDREKSLAAELAYHIIKETSNIEPSSYSEGVFLKIAAFVYEWLTGDDPSRGGEVAGLERSCRRVLKARSRRVLKTRSGRVQAS